MYTYYNNDFNKDQRMYNNLIKLAEEKAMNKKNIPIPAKAGVYGGSVLGMYHTGKHLGAGNYGKAALVGVPTAALLGGYGVLKKKYGDDSLL